MTARDENRVLIFDTTLRDGEQSPGATMTHDEKLEIARQLDELPGSPDRYFGFDPGLAPCERDKAMERHPSRPCVIASVQQLAAIVFGKLPSNPVRSVARPAAL